MNTQMSIICHPGLIVPPVCEDCEGEFLRAQVAGALLKAREAIHVGLLGPEGESSIVLEATAPVSITYKKMPYGRINGLIEDGVYRGFWVHCVRGAWLLARPSSLPGVSVASVESPLVFSKYLWMVASTKLYHRDNYFEITSADEGLDGS